MARTRGAHTDSSPTRNPRPRVSFSRDLTSQAPKAPTIPLFEGGVPSNSPQRIYEMRRPLTTTTSHLKSSVRRTPAKKVRTSGLGESSRPSQPDPRALIDSQLPLDLSLKAIIRRPMGYHLEHLMTPREFFYPRVALDFYQSMTTHGVRSTTTIHFSIDGRHGILEARHIAEALHIPYKMVDLADF
uniref:Uncharacterized protein n=1 Tax=Vitis vinifera TaxID=29760 RepID=A5C3R6_VITVI|nr:hypothetical protein VITISV_027147 [Vitis vinifera]